MSTISIEVINKRSDQICSFIRKLVEHESPSTDKPALDAIGGVIAERMSALGASVERVSREQYGDHWMGTWGNGSGGILLLTHLDTVYPIGTLSSMPWREEHGYIYGPGCLDMKASIAMALEAIEYLQVNNLPRVARVSLICTSDEEIGSPSSREWIEQQAKAYDLVLCLEPALPDGSLKTWRKGILNLEVAALGKAAHAGSDITAGVNAITEICHQVPLILKLEDHSLGTTINIGVIEGGSRSNVVPEHCRIKVDVRAMTYDEGQRVLNAIQGLSARLDNAEIDVKGGWNRPPMERDDLMLATFGRAAELARSIGLELTEGGTGGGSDANFIAGLGVPVLDGLGAIGSGAHSPDERVEVSSLTQRAALLATLLSNW